MILLKLEKQLPDGRVTLYHRVTELNIDFGSPNMTVLLGSWVDATAAQNQGSADAVSALSAPNTEAVRSDIFGYIKTLREWSQAEIIDAP